MGIAISRHRKIDHDLHVVQRTGKTRAKQAQAAFEHDTSGAAGRELMAAKEYALEQARRAGVPPPAFVDELPNLAIEAPRVLVRPQIPTSRVAAAAAVVTGRVHLASADVLQAMDQAREIAERQNAEHSYRGIWVWFNPEVTHANLIRRINSDSVIAEFDSDVLADVAGLMQSLKTAGEAEFTYGAKNQTLHDFLHHARASFQKVRADTAMLLMLAGGIQLLDGRDDPQVAEKRFARALATSADDAIDLVFEKVTSNRPFLTPDSLVRVLHRLAGYASVIDAASLAGVPPGTAVPDWTDRGRLIRKAAKLVSTFVKAGNVKDSSKFEQAIKQIFPSRQGEVVGQRHEREAEEAHRRLSQANANLVHANNAQTTADADVIRAKNQVQERPGDPALADALQQALAAARTTQNLVKTRDAAVKKAVNDIGDVRRAIEGERRRGILIGILVGGGLDAATQILERDNTNKELWKQAIGNGAGGAIAAGGPAGAVVGPLVTGAINIAIELAWESRNFTKAAQMLRGSIESQALSNADCAILAGMSDVDTARYLAWINTTIHCIGFA